MTARRYGRDVVYRRGLASAVRAFVSTVVDPADYGRMPRVRDLDFQLRPGDVVAIDSRGAKRYARVTKVGPARVQTEYTTESAIQTAERYDGDLVVTRKPVRLDDDFLRFAERPTHDPRGGGSAETTTPEEENMAGKPDPKPTKASKPASGSKSKSATSTSSRTRKAASKPEATPETTPEPTVETETTPEAAPEPIVELPSRDSTPTDLAEQVIARVEETTDAVLDRVASPSGADVRLRIGGKTIAYMMIGKRGVSFDVKDESGYERVRVADDSAVRDAASAICVALALAAAPPQEEAVAS